MVNTGVLNWSKLLRTDSESRLATCQSQERHRQTDRRIGMEEIKTGVSFQSKGGGREERTREEMRVVGRAKTRLK